jgi:hypothetical protein
VEELYLYYRSGFFESHGTERCKPEATTTGVSTRESEISECQGPAVRYDHDPNEVRLLPALSIQTERRTVRADHHATTGVDF